MGGGGGVLAFLFKFYPSSYLSQVLLRALYHVASYREDVGQLNCLSLCSWILCYFVKKMLHLILDYFCPHRLWGIQELLWCFSLLNIWIFSLQQESLSVSQCFVIQCRFCQHLWLSTLFFSRFLLLPLNFPVTVVPFCALFICICVLYNIRRKFSISHKWHDQCLRCASLSVLEPLCQVEAIEMSLLHLISAAGWREKCRADVSGLFCWRKVQLADIHMMWASSMSHLRLLPLYETKCTQRLSLKLSSS